LIAARARRAAQRWPRHRKRDELARRFTALGVTMVFVNGACRATTLKMMGEINNRPGGGAL